MPTPISIELEDLRKNLELRHGAGAPLSSPIQYRQSRNYFTPDEWYEVLVEKLVTSEARWLDVGCGRNLMPGNTALSEILAKRCSHLVGIDPDSNVLENEYVHERVQGMIDDYKPSTNQGFDLITFRMVVEHIEDPGACSSSIQNLIKPGGKVVIYTVDKWSTTALCARFSPLWFHHLAKDGLWGTDEKDTFPVQYRMNTRNTLNRLFEKSGFTPVFMKSLPDVFLWKFPKLHWGEIQLIKMLEAVRLPQIDPCMLAVYEKVETHQSTR